MASILMYKGDIYLIDTGPGIPHILLMLGIDVSEIKGIFHTHGHDDHFAGLPGLMQGDHQIKYYATALVRAAVAKKLSALMSMDEELFYQYFDVCDLEADSWNDIDGLEVKPIYSPHPVETNIFLFRALGEDGYKSYAHWADLTSFEVLESMIEEDPSKPGISKEFYDVTRANYLIPADIKKVDIGGGMIHGQIQDFANDQSTKIILAHRSDPLTLKERGGLGRVLCHHRYSHPPEGELPAAEGRRISARVFPEPTHGGHGSPFEWSGGVGQSRHHRT